MQSIKVVVVGDGGVGKTCMLISYVSNTFPTEYMPTVSDTYSFNTIVNGRTINLNLCDTAGQDDYARLRVLSYNDADVFLICFSVESKDSYDNVHNHWAMEVSHHKGGVPTVLVALKTDLRRVDPSNTFKTTDGFELMKKISASKYVECSAQNREGLSEVFLEAAKAVLERSSLKTNGRKKKCKIL